MRRDRNYTPTNEELMDEQVYVLYQKQIVFRKMAIHGMHSAGLTQLEKIVIYEKIYKKESLRKIAEWFNTLKIRRTNGRTWNKDIIHRIYHTAIDKLHDYFHQKDI